jgi:hypothetical protein
VKFIAANQLDKKKERIEINQDLLSFKMFLFYIFLSFSQKNMTYINYSINLKNEFSKQSKTPKSIHP